MNKMHFEKSAYKDDQIVGLSKKTSTDNTSTFPILSLLDQDHRIDRYCYHFALIHKFVKMNYVLQFQIKQYFKK